MKHPHIPTDAQIDAMFDELDPERQAARARGREALAKREGFASYADYQAAQLAQVKPATKPRKRRPAPRRYEEY